MARQLEQTQEIYDMESMSETHTMLRGEQKQQSRWSRTSLVAVSLLALTAVAVAAAIFASGPKASVRKSSGSVVQLSADSVWANVLSPNAMKQYEQEKEMAKEVDQGASEAAEAAKKKVENAINDMSSAANKVVSDAQNAMKQKSDEVASAANKAAQDFQKAASSASQTVKRSQTQAEADAAAAAKSLMKNLMGGDDSSKAKDSFSNSDAGKAMSNGAAQLTNMFNQAQAPAPAAPAPALTFGAVKIPPPPKLPTIAVPKIPAPAAVPPVAPAAVAAVEPPTAKPTDDPSKSALAPQVASSDKDPCSSDQELSGGLCYAKCSTLTQGSHPCRSSAWSCCATADGPNCAEKASMESCWVHPGFCFGYAVGGTEEAHQQGSNCPTNLGGCLVNEEMFMSACYKKCRDLTGGTHSKRVGAVTCCNKDSDFECLWPGNLKSDPTYNVGGGSGDHNSGTPGQSHLPMKSLAESG